MSAGLQSAENNRSLTIHVVREPSGQLTAVHVAQLLLHWVIR